MYSKQILIKIDPRTLSRLKKIAGELGLKASTFARMILKNYLSINKQSSVEDENDIKILKKYRQEKGENFDDFVKNILAK